MNQNNNHINKRIEILDNEIQKLEKRLAAMIWERRKYLQFSEDSTKLKEIR